MREGSDKMYQKRDEKWKAAFRSRVANEVKVLL